MDEPFGALDPITRSEVQDEVIRLQRELGFTAVIVTHDLPEAFKMCHEVLLLRDGQIEQKGRPNELIIRPASDYVVDFLHAHSPGKLLEEIKLYSVFNPDIFLTSESNGGAFSLVHLGNGDSKSVSTQQELIQTHKEIDQKYVYFVDEKRGLKSVKQIKKEGLVDNSVEPVPMRSDFLKGVLALLESRRSAIPVINDNNEVIGVISPEAVRALS